jgi:hypothetical protein
MVVLVSIFIGIFELAPMPRAAGGSISLSFDETRMAAEVGRNIPAGTSLEAARRIMERSGFRRDNFDWWFPEKSCLSYQVIHRTMRSFFDHPLCDDVIYVYLYHSSGKITKTAVRCESIAP